MNKGVVLFDEEELIKNAEVPDGLMIKKGSLYAMSSDLHTPMAPPRPTQTNIGVYLVPEPTLEDSKYGTHGALYGGVGSTDTKYKFAPRSHNHLRTAIDERIPEKVSNQNRAKIVLQNRGHFASPIIEVGFDVHEAHRLYHVDTTPRPVTRSIFPRSVVYELDYIKNEYRKKMLSALERERAAFEEKIARKRGTREKKEDIQARDLKHTVVIQTESQCPTQHVGKSQEVGKPKAPFWWVDGGSSANQSAVDRIDHYTVPKLDTPSERENFARNLGLAQIGEYQPGEVYKGGEKVLAEPVK